MSGCGEFKPLPPLQLLLPLSHLPLIGPEVGNFLPLPPLPLPASASASTTLLAASIRLVSCVVCGFITLTRSLSRRFFDDK